MNIDFEGILTDCSQRLRHPGLRNCLFGWDKAKVDDYLAPHYKLLQKKGQVVWGAVAQANQMAFGAGSTDLPCNVVYSVDPYYDDKPIEVVRIAKAAWYLKHKHPRDTHFAKVAALMSDELNMVARFRLPDAITSSHVVYLASTLLVRERMPGRRLQASLLPLVAAPQETEIVMLLPMQCWSKELCDCWTSIPEVEPHPVVLNLEYLEPPEAGSTPQTKPFSITPGAVQKLKTLIKKHKMKRAFVRLALVPEGHAMDLTEDYSQARDDLKIMHGLNVIWKKEFTDSLLNTTLDYRETSVGGGFMFLDP